MKVLLDTCVISELWRPGGGDARVIATLGKATGASTFLSAVTIGEMTRGIELLAEGKRRKTLAEWLASLEREFGPRVLEIDVETARTWGTLAASRQRLGRPLATADGLIAATAIRHGLAVMTRNVSDFEGTGVQIVNPWQA